MTIIQHETPTSQREWRAFFRGMKDELDTLGRKGVVRREAYGFSVRCYWLYRSTDHKGWVAYYIVERGGERCLTGTSAHAAGSFMVREMKREALA